jgi:hypothetical protein
MSLGEKRCKREGADIANVLYIAKMGDYHLDTG